MSEEFVKRVTNPLIVNPVDRIVYKDNPYITGLGQDEFPYDEPTMNAKLAYKLFNEQKSLVASSDPLKMSDVFYGELADQAKDYLTSLVKIRENPGDKSLTAAVTTSKHYTSLQDNLIVGMNSERIRTGAIIQAFNTIPVPQLTGRWITPAHDLKFHKNLPEGKSPEPSRGEASSATITLQKHGGAVAITERARAVITDMDVYGRLVSQMGDLAQKTFNALVVTELESNTGNNFAGVDWGARSSGNSTNNPVDKLNQFITTFSALSKDATGFYSKWLGWAELIENDFVKGNHAPLPPINSLGAQLVAPFPILPGITYYADDACTSSTAGWLFNREALNIFVGPSRQYTVQDPDNETEKYVTKQYLTPKTVDSSLIYQVTGITA